MSKKPETRRKLLRNLLILAVIIALLMFNVFFIIGTIKYNILRVRFNTSYVQATEYTIEAVWIVDVINDQDGDIWYYEYLGGFYNYKDMDEGTDDHALLLAYSQRLLLEVNIEKIELICLGIRESDGQRLNFTSGEITVKPSGRIVINNIDFATNDIDYDYIEMNYYLEALFGIF